MKPVSLNPLRLQFLGDREDTCDRRQFGVKGGVETRRLRKPGKMLLGRANDHQSRWNVQRRKGGSSLKLPYDCIVDEAMLSELGSAMHDPVADGSRRRHFTLGKMAFNAGYRFPLGGKKCWLRKYRVPPRVFCVKSAFFFADRLSLARQQHVCP